MGALADLGLSTADGGILCVSAPDSVLAEAGAMHPRPSFASTLVTAHPAPRLLWWPERQHLTALVFARLRWLLEMSGGEAWLVLDESDEESPSEDEVRPLMEESGLRASASVSLGRGEVAVPVALAWPPTGSP